MMNGKAFIFLAIISLIPAASAAESENFVNFLEKISGTLSPAKEEKKNEGGPHGRRRKSGDGNPAAQNIVTAGNFVNNNPEGISSVFSEDTPVIYVCFDYSGFKSGEMVQSIWYRAGEKGNWDEMADDAVSIPFSGVSNVCELHHGIPAGSKWKPGSYRVDIIARSCIIGSASFSISESSQSGASREKYFFNPAFPLPEADDKIEIQEAEIKLPSRYSVASRTGENSAVKLKYQGAPGGGVFKGDGFSISYQNGWKYTSPVSDIVVFINPDGESGVTLQKLASFENGGVYRDIPEAFSDVKNRLRAIQDCSIGKENEFTLNNLKYKPFSASYMRNGENFHDWYVMRASPDNKFFYLFRYTSSPDKYNKCIGAARLMFASFKVDGDQPDNPPAAASSPAPEKEGVGKKSSVEGL